MKVKCTTDRWDFLTYGKEYDVIREEDGKYYVYDDEGDECNLCYYECEVIEESVQCNEAFEDYSSYPPPLIIESPINNDISYQEFLNAFDEEVCPSITVRKHEAFIEVNDQSFMCYTKQREQEVMKALIVLYGKREGEN